MGVIDAQDSEKGWTDRQSPDREVCPQRLKNVRKGTGPLCMEGSWAQEKYTHHLSNHFKIPFFDGGDGMD